MPLFASVKSGVVKKIEQYEGRFNHLYLNVKGKLRSVLAISFPTEML